MDARFNRPRPHSMSFAQPPPLFGEAMPGMPPFGQAPPLPPSRRPSVRVRAPRETPMVDIRYKEPSRRSHVYDLPPVASRRVHNATGAPHYPPQVTYDSAPRQRRSASVGPNRCNHCELDLDPCADCTRDFLTQRRQHTGPSMTRRRRDSAYYPQRVGYAPQVVAPPSPPSSSASGSRYHFSRPSPEVTPANSTRRRRANSHQPPPRVPMVMGDYIRDDADDFYDEDDDEPLVHDYLADQEQAKAYMGTTSLMPEDAYRFPQRRPSRGRRSNISSRDGDEDEDDLRLRARHSRSRSRGPMAVTVAPAPGPFLPHEQQPYYGGAYAPSAYQQYPPGPYI